MTIGDNIRKLRVANNMTQEEFGKIADVSSMAVSQWENDRAVPRMGAVQRMSDRFQVPKSEIIDESTFLLPDNAIMPNLNARYAYVPLLGRVHAGDAQEPDIVDEKVPIPYEILEAHPNSYFLEVEGNCMSRVYPEGCRILIDRDVEPRNGSIAVVSINGADYVMRRLYRGASTLVLSPDSWEEGHEDIVLTADDDRTVEFVGTVVWFQAAGEME